MMANLKSEFQKLLTVRATYVTTIITLLFVVFMSFYVEGYRGVGEIHASKLSELTMNISGVAAMIAAIMAILSMIHEYRYNTISYTLTISNSRTKVLAAKLLSTVVYTIVLAGLSIGVGIVTFQFGLGLRDVTLPPQIFDTVNILGRALFFCVGNVLLGLLFATLLRSIALAMGLFFVLPYVVEPLLSSLLKENAVYLPFAALNKVLALPPEQTGGFIRGDLTPTKAMMVVLIYVLSGWLVAWILFKRRDAN